MDRIRIQRRVALVSAVLWIVSVSSSVAGQSGFGVEGSEQSVHGEPRLVFGPVSGFTTSAHDAPARLVLPLGSWVPFAVEGLAPTETVVWEGVAARNNPDLGALPFLEETPLCIVARVFPGGKRLECCVTPRPLRPESLLITTAIAADVPFVLTEDASNASTTAAWFGESIAPVVHLGDHVATSIRRTLRLSAHATLLGASVPMPAVSGLLEWRVDGHAVGAGDATFAAQTPGRHLIEAGPPGFAISTDLVAWRTHLISDVPVGSLVEDVPVHYSAVTEPPGYEHFLVWLASTKSGSAEPTLGRGQRFETVFSDTYGLLGGALWSWTGVKAAEAVLGNDDTSLTACGSATVVHVTDFCGRPDIGLSGMPNGTLHLDFTTVSSFGSNTCSLLPGLPPNTTETTYVVTGNNLNDVSTDIYDAQNGEGFCDGGTRFAGSAQLGYSYGWTIVAQQAQGDNISATVQITSLTWTTTVRLPDWDPPQGTPPAQIAEWNRFMDALREHEHGHAEINNTHMTAIETRLVSVAAGQVKVVVTKVPEYDEQGNPAKPEDATADAALCAAIGALVEAHASTATMGTAQDSYDDPLTVANPTGTDHGKEQDAVLDTDLDGNLCE